MPNSTFSVFLDEGVSSQTASKSKSTTGRTRAHDSSEPATKENINPLTGICFDVQPPLKRRKPSSTSALKAKHISSSSKSVSKHKKSSTSGVSKDKLKKRTVLGAKENANMTEYAGYSGGTEEEQLRSALGNRRAYEFTVMPLANVTQAYDASEPTRFMTQANLLPVEDSLLTAGMTDMDISEENGIEACDETSKEVISTQTVIAIEA